MILLVDKVAFVQVYIREPRFFLSVQFQQFSIHISMFTLFLPEKKWVNFGNLPKKQCCSGNLGALDGRALSFLNIFQWLNPFEPNIYANVSRHK
jgi:hypothetical protein